MIRALCDHIRFQARLRPNALAVLGPAAPISYQALVRDVDGLATELLERGLTRDDMVGILMGTAYLHLLAILALDRLSIPSMSFAFAEPIPALPTACRQFQLSAVVSVAAAPTELPCRWVQMALDPHRPKLAQPDAARLARLDSPADALVRVIWSSGTTGGAKGAAILRTAQAHRLANRQLLHGIGPHARYFAALPFSAPSYVVALATLASGGAVVLPSPAADVIGLMNAFGVTMTTMVPAQLAELAELAGRLRQHLETVECLDVTGAHLPSKLAETLRLELTQNLRTNYGASETAQVAAMDAALCIADPAAAGFPLPWAEIEIVDLADRPVPVGREGRVRTRTAQMIAGYYRDPELTRRNLRGGWFYPGDIGVITDTGLLRVLGRVEDVITRDGVGVSPLPLEEQIRGLPGVRDVAVFGLPRADGMQEVCAALVLDPGADAATIQAGATARLGPQAPTRMFRVEQLPRNPNGKVMRRELIDWAQRAAKP